MRRQAQIIYEHSLQTEAMLFNGTMQSFAPHFHDYYVIGITQDGSRKLNCGAESYTLRPGSVTIFAPGVSHSCTPLTAGFKYRCFNIAAPTAESLLPNTFNGFNKILFYNEGLYNSLLILHNNFWNGGSNDRHKILRRLFALLVRHNNTALPQNIIDENITKTVCRFIEAHSDEQIILEDLCRAAGVSASTLRRAFTKTKGITPHQYLLAVRINKACTLLKSGYNLTTTALASGFCSQSHFTNTFVKIMGLTPGAYSNLFLQQGVHSSGN